MLVCLGSLVVTVLAGLVQVSLGTYSMTIQEAWMAVFDPDVIFSFDAWNAFLLGGEMPEMSHRSLIVWNIRIPRVLVAILVGGTMLVAINVGFLFLGQEYTTGGIAAIVYSLNPILTTVFAALLFGGARLDARGYLGVALGLAGVGLIANPSPTDLAGPTTIGVGLVFVASVSVSLGSVLIQELSPESSAISRTAYSMVLGALLLHTASFTLGEPVPVVAELSPLVFAAMLFLGVFASAFAYGLYFTLIERIGPFESNLVAYVVPVIATVLGAVLLDEPVTVFTVGGFVLVVAGFGLVKRKTLAAELERLRAPDGV
jgi:drug/metabolite transporter (DMT)-like permease